MAATLMSQRIPESRSSMLTDEEARLKKQRDAGAIDEIIEERDREGRVVKNKYIKSKLLGKVNTSKLFCCI
jgi:phage I-like protein